MRKSMFLAAVAALIAAPAASVAQRAPIVPASPAEAKPTTAPALAVVVDPEAHTAVLVPLNPRSDTPPEVTATLAGLYAAGKIKPGQIVQVVVQRGNRVTEVISNAPIPERRR